MIQRYKTRYAANKAANKMIGWQTRVYLEDGEYYIIQCNGNKYLMADGFVR